MRNFFPLLLFILAFACNPPQQDQPATDLASHVDPMIGTDFFGHTYPGATVPYAMVQLSPDNDTDGWTYSSGYSYKNTTIRGFSHTHFSGVGYNACGDVLMMPTVADQLQVVPGTASDPDSGYRSRFDHSEETATPGYYAVKLKDYNIRAELTATKRVGLQRYTFPKAQKANIVVDLAHSIGGTEESDISTITMVNDSTITGVKTGKGIKVFFVAKFSRPFDYYGTFDSGYATPESGASVFPYKSQEQGRSVGAFVVYSTKANEQILVKTGISYTSVEGAINNLKTELNHWDFEKVKNDARRAWNDELARLTVKTPDNKKKTIFYTAMYHSILAQQISQDVDGQYFGMDGKIHKKTDGDFFPSFSCWDTYRSEHPLKTLVDQKKTNEMVQSIVAKTKAYGWLPAQHFRNEARQSMVGDHLIPIVVDAYMKGIRDFDIESIYEAMKTKALQLPAPPVPMAAARSGLKDYINLGYAPYDQVTESVPNTVELAYNDWCIAQLAKALNKEEDYELFAQRALNYRNLFDTETQFMRPRKADGSWLPLLGNNEQRIVEAGDHSYYQYFDPLLVGRRPNRHYTESNAWQYLWSVQHDPAGLIELLGGKDQFAKRLDTFFTMSPNITPPKYVGVVGTIGQYVHGNQPSHHVAYLYNYAGQPWKTQQRVRQVMEQMYRTGQGGICGNEDMGSLSSWYVLSAMGFYPVTPGQSQYTIGSPLMDEATLQLPEGKNFRVIAENNTADAVYIQSATLNGAPLERSWIDHSEIMAGGVLQFVMGTTPNKVWASQDDAIPFSMSK